MVAIDGYGDGPLKKLVEKHANRRDDQVADYLGFITRSGDRAIQVGYSEFGSVLLKRGVRLDMLAPLSVIETLQALCERRAISHAQLRGVEALATDADHDPIDIALIGTGLGFPALAGNWRHIAARLKPGGKLVLFGADHGSGAQLADALAHDEGWQLQEFIAGEAAVFCKTDRYSLENVTRRLGEAGRPGRRPQGLKKGLLPALFRWISGRGPKSRTEARPA